MDTHNFEVNSYKTPTFCVHCKKLLVGLFKQGLKCTACNVDIHKGCFIEYRERCPCYVEVEPKFEEGQDIPMKVVLFHGLESGPGGSKHRWLLKNYGMDNVVCRDMDMSLWRLGKKNGIARSVFDAIKSGSSSFSFGAISAASVERSLQGCLNEQRAALLEAKTWKRKILIASSWGGAVATLALAEGLWEGPVILIAPALGLVTRYSSERDLKSIYKKINETLTAEQKACCLIVHGTNDNVVEIADSKLMSSETGIPLLQIEGGDHRLNDFILDKSDSNSQALLSDLIDNLDRTSQNLSSNFRLGSSGLQGNEEVTLGKYVGELKFFSPYHSNIHLCFVQTKVGSSSDEIEIESRKMLDDCIEYIRDHIEIEGLFRVPGNKSVLNDLENLYAANESENHLRRFPGVDASEACSLLKIWISSLGKPIVPNNEYLQINQVMEKIRESTSSEAKSFHEVEVLNLAFNLPKQNQVILFLIVNLLKEVASNSKNNKMTASNLGICLAPCIFPAPDDTPPTDLIRNIKSSAKYLEFLINTDLENK